MGRRVIRVISIEGNADWVERVLAKSRLREGDVIYIYTKVGTVKELQRIELGDGEQLEAPLAKITLPPYPA